MIETIVEKEEATVATMSGQGDSLSLPEDPFPLPLIRETLHLTRRVTGCRRCPALGEAC